MHLAARPASWEPLDRKVRNQIRKAEKSGLTVERGGDRAGRRFLHGVCAEHARSRHAGLFAPRLFEEVLRTFPDRAQLHVVRLKDDAGRRGADLPHADDGAAAVGIVDSRLQPAVPERPAVLGRDSVRAGQRMRRSSTSAVRRPSEGTFKFKAQWGAQPVPLHWEYQLLTGRSAAQRQSGQSQVSARDRAVAEAARSSHATRRADDRSGNSLKRVKSLFF